MNDDVVESFAWAYLCVGLQSFYLNSDPILNVNCLLQNKVFAGYYLCQWCFVDDQTRSENMDVYL